MRLKITMLQQSEYWSLVRVRFYALDAQLVRRCDASTVAETLEYMASPTERAMSLLNIDWNDRYFSELVYTSALMKTIQLVGEEMSKKKNIHMRERYDKIPWDCFIDIRPVLAHYMYEQIDISRLEEIADKDIPRLISSIGDIIGESGLDLEI